MVYHFHLSKGYELKVKPFLDTCKRGIFSTRAPKRPNNIGISVVKLVKIEDNWLYVENVDIINETPLLDIKPYITEFEKADNISTGWLSKPIIHIYRHLQKLLLVVIRIIVF